jgi:RHS repeat-associated protein
LDYYSYDKLEDDIAVRTYFLNGLDVLSKFLHGAGMDEPLQVDSATLSASYLQDRLGSTSQLLDSANGSVKTRYDYKSYGKLEGGLANPESRNPFTYTAREDDGTSLMYYRARYYDPELEAFISEDPLGGAQRYVGGNPMRFVDPLGLDYWDFNVTGGYIGGITGGIYYGQTSPGAPYTVHPYLGGGLTTPGASVSVNYSPSTISPGCFSGQISGEVGPLFGAVGKTLTAPSSKGIGSSFWETGLGWGFPVPFGASGVGYYTW